MDCQGRISNGVFKSTGFQKLMENSTLNLPQKSALPGQDKLSPYVFVADDAFPLSLNIMKPYSGHQPNAAFPQGVIHEIEPMLSWNMFQWERAVVKLAFVSYRARPKRDRIKHV